MAPPRLGCRPVWGAAGVAVGALASAPLAAGVAARDAAAGVLLLDLPLQAADSAAKLRPAAALAANARRVSLPRATASPYAWDAMTASFERSIGVPLPVWKRGR